MTLITLPDSPFYCHQYNARRSKPTAAQHNSQTNKPPETMKKTLLIFLLIFSSAFVRAQDVITDPKGNFIFGVPSTTIQPQVSSSNVGVQIPIIFFSKKLYYIVDRNTSDTIYTMAKSKVLFMKANVVSNSKSTLIFNAKTNYSPSIEIGHSWGFDSLMVPSSKAGFYMTYAASVFAEYQNFNYYDTTTQAFSPTKTKRISPGIRGNFTVFKSTKFAVSFSASYQKSINTDNLTSYQKMSNTFYWDTNISSNGQNDGYLSPVDPVKTLRLSLSVPQFWISGNWNKKIPFAVAPYFYGVYADGSESNNNVGVVLSFLGTQFRKYDRNSDNTYNKKARYKFAQAFNIGYNFVSTGSKDPRFFFVSGTFSLSALKPKKVSKATSSLKQE